MGNTAPVVLAVGKRAVWVAGKQAVDTDSEVQAGQTLDTEQVVVLRAAVR